MSLLFDVPVSEETEEAPVEKSDRKQATLNDASAGKTGLRNEQETDRPAIEETLDWDEAREMLPKDSFGQVDWMAALRDGVIRPRALDPDDRLAEAFKLDFYLPNDNPKFDAFFPHTAHNQWLGCDSCHAAIFPQRNNAMSMAEIFQGKYCGACHGKVGFALNACARCHQSM